jgi:hypothetical protein
MRYYLEIVEGADRIPVGHRLGYATPEEAKAAARQHVDDAMPHNRVNILAHVATAYLRGDGEEVVRDEES